MTEKISAMKGPALQKVVDQHAHHTLRQAPAGQALEIIGFKPQQHFARQSMQADFRRNR